MVNLCPTIDWNQTSQTRALTPLKDKRTQTWNHFNFCLSINIKGVDVHSHILLDACRSALLPLHFRIKKFSLWRQETSSRIKDQSTPEDCFFNFNVVTWSKHTLFDQIGKKKTTKYHQKWNTYVMISSFICVLWTLFSKWRTQTCLLWSFNVFNGCINGNLTTWSLRRSSCHMGWKFRSVSSGFTTFLDNCLFVKCCFWR